MEEREPFIAAIEACPEDHTARLVYADWLDERNHPAGKCLRTKLRLASLPEVTCASVEAFFYRWWLENALWHKLASPRFDFHDPHHDYP